MNLLIFFLFVAYWQSLVWFTKLLDPLRSLYLQYVLQIKKNELIFAHDLIKCGLFKKNISLSFYLEKQKKSKYNAKDVEIKGTQTSSLIS